MTLIDQRILIDAPPHIVWDFIADPAKITRWHTAYRSISVLTTQQTGLGTRRRCTMADGSKDTIEEITAWVEGLGYEYTLIEGGPYSSFRGRLRLTAGPDGTTVQWTVTYRPRGLFRGVSNLISGRRQMQAMMAEALRRLRRQVDELGLRMDADYRQRVSMRGRLNHSERLEYQRRHAQAPTPSEALAPVSEPMAPGPAPAIPPAGPGPIARPAAELPLPPQIRPPAPAVPLSPTPAPSFVDDLLRQEDAAAHAQAEPAADVSAPQVLRDVLAVFESPPALEDLPGAPTFTVTLAQDNTPVRLPPRPVVTPQSEPLIAAPEPLPAPPVPDHSLPTPPRGIPAVRVPGEAEPVSTDAVLPHEPAIPAGPSPEPAGPLLPVDRASAPTPPRGIPSVPPPSIAAQSRPPVPRQERPDLPPPTPATDTGELSIWEVFGIRRPSERDAEALQELISSVSNEPQPRRARKAHRLRWARRSVSVRRLQIAIGLRARLARQHARLRHFRAR